MDDPYELVWAMLGLVLCALLLVGGEIYLATTTPSEPVERASPPPVTVSSAATTRMAHGAPQAH